MRIHLVITRNSTDLYLIIEFSFRKNLQIKEATSKQICEGRKD